MGGVKVFLVLASVAAAGPLSAPSALAQASVETGGTTAGAANNVSTLAPNFTGLSSIITDTAATVEPTQTPADTRVGMSAADQPATSDSAASDVAPDDSGSSGQD